MKILRLSYHSCKCSQSQTANDAQHLSFQGDNIQERKQNVKVKMRIKYFFCSELCLNIFFRKKKESFATNKFQKKFINVELVLLNEESLRKITEPTESVSYLSKRSVSNYKLLHILYH